MSVVVQKHGVNSEDVVLTLTSHLFHEVSEDYADGMDPAECKQKPITCTMYVLVDGVQEIS